MPQPKSVNSYPEHCWQLFAEAAAGTPYLARFRARARPNPNRARDGAATRDEGLVEARMFVFQMNGFRAAVRRWPRMHEVERALVPAHRRQMMQQMMVNVEEVVVRAPVLQDEDWTVTIESRFIQREEKEPLRLQKLEKGPRVSPGDEKEIADSWARLQEATRKKNPYL